MSRSKEGLCHWGIYTSFESLKQEKEYGVDYCIHYEKRGSMFAIMAPHGGTIEPGTELIAQAIAGEEHSLYVFEGLTEGRELHITSHNFDEPYALALAESVEHVVTIHGYPSHEGEEFLLIGGKHIQLRNSVMQSFIRGGFPVIEDVKSFDSRVQGVCSKNICNRGASKDGGVQIEISFGLINSLLTNPDNKRRFAGVVRAALDVGGSR